VLAELADARRDAFFVQIGSNDGEQLDPLRAQILERGWSGIMVEPVPFVFERLRANYGHLPNVTLVNVAIDAEDGTRELYYLPQSDDEGLPQWYDALGSFRREVVLKHEEFIPDIASRVATIEVACLTFDSLCRRHGVRRVDVIQIDTEGYDFEIVRSIDLDRYRPAVLMYEHLHLDADTHRASIEHVARFGYETMSNGMDTLCLRVGTPTWRDRRVRRLWRELRNDPPPGIL
jgi:FkbM family methyltransferase